MPRAACHVCGAPALPGSTRCGLHPRAARPAQRRAYRGLAGYRAMRRVVLDGDPPCAECGRPGADEIDHVIPYSQQDPTTRDDPSTWSPDDFRPVHAACNKQRGTKPIT